MTQNIGKSYWATATGGTAAAITATIPGLDSLKYGDIYTILTPIATTGALTIDINGLGAVPVKTPTSADPSIMPANYEMFLIWNTSEFVLQNNPASAGASANNGNSVNGANVVLGQDVGQAGNPAQLTSDREIPTNGFNLNFNTASATDTQIKDNGDVVVGGNYLGVAGIAGSLEAIIDVGRVQGTPRNTSTAKITGATFTSRAADLTSVHGETVVGSGSNGFVDNDGMFEYVNWYDAAGTFINTGSANLMRGVSAIYNVGRTALTEIKHLIASSRTGQYYFGEAGWRTGTSNPAELPVTSTASTLENLAIDTSNGQVVRTPLTAGVAMRARRNGAFAVPNGTPTLVDAYSIVPVDTHSAFNATTGVYTAPETGSYLVSSFYLYAPSFPLSSYETRYYDSPITTAHSIANHYGSGYAYGGQSSVVELTAGQTIGLFLFQSTGTTQNTFSGFSIEFKIIKIR